MLLTELDRASHWPSLSGVAGQTTSLWYPYLSLALAYPRMLWKSILNASSEVVTSRVAEVQHRRRVADCMKYPLRPQHVALVLGGAGGPVYGPPCSEIYPDCTWTDNTLDPQDSEENFQYMLHMVSTPLSRTESLLMQHTRPIRESLTNV